MINELSTTQESFSTARYRQLAELRFRIRRFLQLSEQVARTHGIEPQQHQLMLTIKGLPLNTLPTVSALANRLCLRHHSTVELINRLVERGAAERKPSQKDRRQVLVELTPAGEELLERLKVHHSEELQTFAPELVAVLTGIVKPVDEVDSDTPQNCEASDGCVNPQDSAPSESRAPEPDTPSLPAP